jgi:hypothetical protein
MLFTGATEEHLSRTIKDACANLRQKGANQVLLTLGHRGSCLVGPDTYIRVPLTERVDAIDTTGAGDAFTAAFASYVASGLELKEAMKCAGRVATLSVQRKGCQTSYSAWQFLPADLQQPLLNVPGRNLIVKWEKTGTVKAGDGVELENPKLATKLESQIESIEFSRKEWAEFGISDLSMDHFIQVGGSYWKPAGEGQK